MSYMMQTRKMFEAQVQELRASIMRLSAHAGAYPRDRPHLYAADLQLGNLIRLPETMPCGDSSPVPGGLDHSLPNADKEMGAV